MPGVPKDDRCPENRLDERIKNKQQQTTATVLQDVDTQYVRRDVYQEPIK